MNVAPDFCEFGCSWECEHRPDRYGHVTVLPDGSIISQPMLDWYELFRERLVALGEAINASAEAFACMIAQIPIFALSPDERRAAHVARRRDRLRVRRRSRRRARVRR